MVFGENLLILYLPSIVITLANFITPMIFAKIIHYEDYSPGFEIKLTILRWGMEGVVHWAKHPTQSRHCLLCHMGNVFLLDQNLPWPSSAPRNEWICRFSFRFLHLLCVVAVPLISLLPQKVTPFFAHETLGKTVYVLVGNFYLPEMWIPPTWPMCSIVFNHPVLILVLIILFQILLFPENISLQGWRDRIGG